MDAVIKISPEEFDKNLFDKIKLLLKNSSDSKVIIEIASKENVFEDPASEYWSKINQSIKELEEGKGTVFTIQELDEYLSKHFPG
jgi:protein tyrosine phosphatase